MDTTILQNIHNVLRWAVLLFGLLSLIVGLRGMGGGRDFTVSNKRTAFYFLLACDTQLLIGLILYYFKGYYRLFSTVGMKEMMKVQSMRFWSVEHLVGMVIAILFVHIGYTGTKGVRPSQLKFRRLFWCTLIALLIIAFTIPWPFRAPGVARPWLPGVVGV